MQDIEQKLDELKKFISEKGRDGVVIAFSGGVDSSTLASVSHEILGKNVVAVIAKSPTYTVEEYKDAEKTAASIGIKLKVIKTDELLNPDFTRNPENRCYYCKKELLKHLSDYAKKIKFKVVFEGTNYSDLNGHRPGFKAVQEAENVYSPWVITKFSKEETRQVAKKIGLRVSEKPALACLASRIPFNQEITPEKLKRIENAERTVKKLTGVKQIRIRDHNGLARIEVLREERQFFCNIEILDKIALELRKLGFDYVTFDLEGYCSGNMLKMIKT